MAEAKPKSRLEKRCTKCEAVKSTDDFSPDVRCRYGVRGICKQCQSRRNLGYPVKAMPKPPIFSDPALALILAITLERVTGDPCEIVADLGQCVVMRLVSDKRWEMA